MGHRDRFSYLILSCFRRLVEVLRNIKCLTKWTSFVAATLCQVALLSFGTSITLTGFQHWTLEIWNIKRNSKVAQERAERAKACRKSVIERQGLEVVRSVACQIKRHTNCFSWFLWEHRGYLRSVCWCSKCRDEAWRCLRSIRSSVGNGGW